MNTPAFVKITIMCRAVFGNKTVGSESKKVAAAKQSNERHAFNLKTSVGLPR